MYLTFGFLFDICKIHIVFSIESYSCLVCIICWANLEYCPVFFISLFFKNCFDSPSCLCYAAYLRGHSPHCNLCTPLKLYLSVVFPFVLKWCFIVFLVLYAIPVFVFLNNFVIVLVSNKKYVKVAHFYFVLN
jgi:hypothetical protein